MSYPGKQQKWMIYSKFGSYIFMIFIVCQLINYFMVVGYFPSYGLANIYISMLVIMVIVWVLADCWKHWNIARLSGWFLLLSIITIQIIWYPEFSHAGALDIYLSTTAQTIVLSLLMWMIGEAMGASWRTYKKIELRYLVSIFWVCYFILIIIVLLGLYTYYNEFGQFVFYFSNYESGLKFNYLQLSDLIAIIGFLIMGYYYKKFKVQFLIYISTTVLLFYSYSRTSFFIFCLLGFLWIWIQHKKSRKWMAFFLIIIAFIASLYNLYLSRSLLDYQESSRMFKIIVDPLSDNSLKGRLELFHLGMGNLRNSIFTGKFIGEWWNNEAAGGYIHNWLSFLSAYGLIPFIFFIFLIIYLFFLGFVSYNKSGNLLPLILLLFATIAIITSRSYVWPFIWFVLGFSSSYRVGGFNNEDSVPISLE
jgi:hypothetical protein